MAAKIFCKDTGNDHAINGRIKIIDYRTKIVAHRNLRDCRPSQLNDNSQVTQSSNVEEVEQSPMTISPELREEHATAAMYPSKAVRESCERPRWQAATAAATDHEGRHRSGQRDPDREPATEAMIELHEVSLRDFSLPGRKLLGSISDPSIKNETYAEDILV